MSTRSSSVHHWGTDDCSTIYDEMTSSHPQHEFIYRFMATRSLGDVTGKAIVDMPSGEGKYTCDLLSRGAGWVTSVDIAPKMLELTAARVAELSLSDKHCNVQADVTKPIDLRAATKAAAATSTTASTATAASGAPFDHVLGNFLFEYCATVADLEQVARNVFSSLACGGKFVVMYVPGAKGAEDIAHVKAVLGIEATVLDPAVILPGDIVKIKYHAMEPTYCYEIHYWPVQFVVDALTAAGFTDATVSRCEVDPRYTGSVDLARFAAHSGNRHIVCKKPLAV